MTSAAKPSTVDAAEVAQFSAIAEQWWDERGKFAPLHRMNPTRLSYIRERIESHFGRLTGPESESATPLKNLTLLDVGSGGGLPGVVFAICCPDVDVSCVDTVGKKAAFIQQAAVALKLRNLHGVHARVETLSTPFDLISCRAFASLPDFVTWSRSALAAPHGVWLAMKGKHPEDEIAALPADVAVFHVEQLTVPGLDAERCIVWMKPV